MAESIEELSPPRRTPRSDVICLLGAVGLLVLGNGLQGTLLALRAESEGVLGIVVGLFMSAYFAGYAAGSVLCPNIVTRVGHIRAFATFASIASGIALLHAIFVDPYVWILLRAAHGVCYAGLILVTESWLNGETDSAGRGRLLSVYVNVVLAGWGASQPLLYLAPVEGFVLFCLVSILLSFSLVPVTLANVGQTGAIDARRMKVGNLMRISPLGTVGTFVVGVQIASFWALGPVAALRLGLDKLEVSLILGTSMLGALLLQTPLGRLSDRISRGLVVIACAIGAGLVCLPLIFEAEYALPTYPVLLVYALLFGALTIPTYSICVAHVNDHAAADSLASVASGLILVYGAGATLGPLMAGAAVWFRGPEGLFEMSLAVQLAFVAFAGWRLVQATPVPAELKQRFVALPRTTPAALGLYHEDREARRRRREIRRRRKQQLRMRQRRDEVAALRGAPPPTARRRRG